MPAGSPTNRGTGVILRDLRADALSLTPELFAERHGDGFLLLTAAGLSLPRGPESTEVKLFDDDEGPAAETTASLALVAYPVRRTGRSAGHLVTIGRASNNDIVIPDLSISRFHAFLKEPADGRFVLQDAGSTNGTTLNGRSVPRQGHGAPLDLKGGDTLRFGQVELTWLAADAFHAFVAQMER